MMQEIREKRLFSSGADEENVSNRVSPSVVRTGFVVW